MKAVKVLVVDDDPSMRALLEIALSTEAGVSEVRTAGNGKEAIEVCEVYAPDVLITDSVLPGASGEELAEVVKAKHPAVRVISFSGLDRRAAWADEVVPKGSVNALEEIRSKVLGPRRN